MIKRANLACKYFPCHKGLEDCTFCYCPFYPCWDETRGKYVFSPKTGKNIWSCQECNWIHKRRTVDNILNSVRKGNIDPYKKSRKLEAKNTGIIILGHGSRIKKANQTIRKVIAEIRRKACPGIIEPAHLQLYEPNLAASVKKIVKKGCKKIVIVPFFLFAGNHVTRDVPREIKRQARIYKDIEFVYTKNIGDDFRISGIVFDCIKEAL